MTKTSGAIRAKVVSAAQLREDQISALEKLLKGKLGTQVDISLEIDPSLIGGFYIYVDSRCFDRSVKKQIGDMKESILRSLV